MGTIPQIAFEKGLVTEEHLHIAKIEQERTGKSLDCLLKELGFITEKVLTELRGGITSLSSIDIDASLLNLFTKKEAEELCALPLKRQENTLCIAISDPQDILTLDKIRSKIKEEIDFLVAPSSKILEAIHRLYEEEIPLAALLQQLEVSPEEHPVIQFIDRVIQEAIHRKASDIHFEPEAFYVRLRLRIDGILYPLVTFHRTYWPALCVRLKVISGMNISDSRRPQDGRLTFKVGLRDIDIRVATHPTVHGENVVLRLLDKEYSLRPLDELGFFKDHLSKIRHCLNRPEGLFVVTGPTGSGKTTTLYSLLSELNASHLNIMTLEEPVEYELNSIRQTDLRSAPFSYGEGIRSILRQDPDVIFIGEIRDTETAQMALRAAMTGHRVLTTLHTNDALGVVYRLMDLGLSPTMLSGTLVGALAQRLIRKQCKICEAEGCDDCHYRGYKERTVIAEVVDFTGPLEYHLKDPPHILRAAAKRTGFKTMQEEAPRLVENKITSWEEIHRVLGKQ